MNEPPAAGVPRVMLLSLWRAAGHAWHARVVEADASVREFDSPFELARFLAEPERERPVAHAPPAGGLR